jgi:hypothetical protein
MNAGVEATRERLPEVGKRQAGRLFLLGTSLLLRASCPTPFGPASLLAHAPACGVDKQKRSASRSAGVSKPLALDAEDHSQKHRGRAPSYRFREGERFLLWMLRTTGKSVARERAPGGFARAETLRSEM